MSMGCARVENYWLVDQSLTIQYFWPAKPFLTSQLFWGKTPLFDILKAIIEGFLDDQYLI